MGARNRLHEIWAVNSNLVLPALGSVPIGWVPLAWGRHRETA